MNAWRLHAKAPDNEIFYVTADLAQSLMANASEFPTGALDGRILGQEDVALVLSFTVNSVTVIEQERRVSFTDKVTRSKRNCKLVCKMLQSNVEND